MNPIIRARAFSFLVGTAALLAAAAGLRASEPSPSIGWATRHARSARVRDYRATGPVAPRPNREVHNDTLPKKSAGSARPSSDRVLQKHFGLSQPEPQGQFEGLSETDNANVVGYEVVPPDTEGDVGPNHYIQYVNNVVTIYDKSGAIVSGPLPGNVFWAGFGGPCEVQDDGDPLVKYDRQADRWVFSQFALPNYPDGPFYQCFAVSTTNDPTGDYWQYEFKTSDDFFTDYGKIGVWPDAYYMSFNMFGPNGEFQGGAYAFDRAAMLAGASAGMIAFDTGLEGGVLPSDLDGPTLPPAGAPNYFMTFDVGPARLLEWQFHVDWVTPSNSTFTGPIEIPVADFLSPVCDEPSGRGRCVPQLDSPEMLETLENRLMYRLPYRNFGDHQALVLNHTVGTESGSAAIRWYEVRDPGDTPSVYQQGTYAPDSNFRWMGSIAMDRDGNIALGYSESSASMHPAIALTGRLAGDPLGILGAEDVWFAGGGSQTASSSRWGDYSTMSVDPVDDCTFWYTQEYYATTGSFDFKTRIGAFRFPSCTSGPSGMLDGSVTDGSGPVAGATVTATPSGARPADAGSSTTTTDDAGHYQFLSLPAGAYDVSASKFGYGTASAAGVVVAGGAETVENFTLAASASAVVNGVVRDGSGQGWPLYAKLVVSGPPGFPGATIFTDPATGYYSISLVAGAAYGFAVTAMTPGYSPGGGSVTVPGPSTPASTAGALVANWNLAAAPTCTAPGYGPGSFVPPLVLAEGFDGGAVPAGWSVDTVSGVSWQVASGADPCGQFSGNDTGGSGPYAILNSECYSDGSSADDSSLVTPPMDLSGRSNAALQWANEFIDEGFGSTAMVDVSIDGGASWTNVWQAPGDLPGPNTQIADLSLAAGHTGVKARFHYQGFWAWWWQVDDVAVGTFACTPLPGGLVVGTVVDANTGVGLVGAVVANVAGGSPATTIATPGDPGVPGGFYALFSDSGPQSIEAAYPAHHPLTRATTVVPNGTTRLDFGLASGSLAANPSPLAAYVAPGGALPTTLTITNSGTGSAAFLLQEVNVPPPGQASAGRPRFANGADRRAALKRVPRGRLEERSAKGLPPLPKAPARAAALAAAGNVVASFPTGLASGWGLAFDTDASRLWISNPDAPFYGFSGDGLEYQYLSDGTPTGDTVDIHATGGDWQADGTYDGRTGKIWQVNVGGDNCLFEIDPAAKVVTGAKICGPWTTPQRAVAYDYATDTFYVGGPNEAVVYHLDASGNLLDSAYIGIAMVGLAYNPTTHHLFVNAESASPFQIWVVDTSAGYAILGGFSVTSGGTPALPNGAVSLEADCQGRLWVLDATAQVVYGFESGEAGWCANDIPWLSENPTQGTIAGTGGSGPAGGGSLPVEVTFDGAGLLPGLRQGSLIFQTQFAPAMPPVPVSFTVLFNDVPQGSFAWNYIYGAAGSGVMPGCAPQTPAFDFCPAQVVTRRSMAAFIERAVHGAYTPPPVYLGEFDDVQSGSTNANYIQGLLDDRITAGCSVSPPLYCPDVPVTRAQMAVFVWKAQHGDEAPPSCTPPGTFADVACPGGFAVDYIEGIYAEGVTAGCGNGDYCPDAAITNAQMAVYLVKAFSLPYLP